MSVHAEVSRAIKLALRTRGHTYAWLAEKVGVSESSVKRLLSRGGITLERLDAICAALNLDLADLLQAGSSPPETMRQLTLEQEEALADDPQTLAMFYMLLNGWTASRAAAACRLSPPRLIRILTRLDRINVINLLPGNRVRLLVTKDHLWRPNGPLRKRYRQEAMNDFVKSPFTQGDEYLRFEVGHLGASGIDQLRRRIDRLTREFTELTELEKRFPLQERNHTVALVLAFRPWDYMRFLQSAEIGMPSS